MGDKISLTTSDGHQLDAYRAEPSGAPKGGLVVVQEIFGVNSQIRSTVDHFAGLGYTAIAPALFDRVGKDIELGVPVRPGDAITTTSRITELYEKTGRSGSMFFVIFRNELVNQRGEMVAQIDCRSLQKLPLPEDGGAS